MSEVFPSAVAFDLDQRAVIEESPETRMVVEAGPGCGKTAVACARVASLMLRDVSPDAILLISFTRTAVAELRQRIRTLSASVVDADRVRISTLDSEAWRFRSGFEAGDGPKLFDGYETGITRALELLKRPADDMRDYLESFAHVIVDEAQDITEDRAHLVRRILELLKKEAGVTVFGDPCQAIYGWTSAEDGEGSRKPAQTLLELLEVGDFSRRTLSTIHRTTVPEVVALFSESRRLLLEGHSGSLHTLLTASIAATPEEVEDEIAYGSSTDATDVLVLHRTRVEVLRSSAKLLRDERAHRLRLPGYGKWLVPELMTALVGCEGRVLEDTFAERMAASGWKSDAAAVYQDLLAQSGSKRSKGIQLETLNETLLSRPPDDLLVKDGGVSGPILSTVHASKGREAPRVILSLPSTPSHLTDELEAQEEARVLYVAATRAHRSVWRQEAEFRPTTKTPSGRCFLSTARGVFFEIGLDGDFDFLGATSAHPSHRLEALSSLAAGDELVAVLERSSSRDAWTHVLYSPRFPDVGLARLSATATNDLWHCARLSNPSGKPPQAIASLVVVGLQTIVVSVDNPLRPSLQACGMFLAPVVRGFPFLTASFNKRS